MTGSAHVDELLARGTPNDRAFFDRVFATPEEIYIERLTGLGFTGMNHVIDAGCGFGQWTAALATLNHSVTGVDVEQLRIDVLREVARRRGLNNVRAVTGSITALPLPDVCADGVYCYGVIFAADYRRALQEFRRVLRPGGRLYLTANGPGWFVHNLVSSPNRVPGFSPRRMVLRSIRETVRYALAGQPPDHGQLDHPSPQMARSLAACGFSDVRIGGESRLSGGRQFFRDRMWGLEAVYEAVGTR